MTLALRYTVRSDVGLLREGNEDSAYAGPHLLAIADGMGGHAAGEVASAVAIKTLASLDAEIHGTDMLRALGDAIANANSALRQITIADPATEGMGTTVTALLWSGDEVALCHIGDSRAYLLRDTKLQQITHDHTLVQSLVDEGQLTREAAASHPQRSLVMRALQSSIPADPDLAMLEAKVGDRYLLCSDGLTDVVSDDTLQATLLRLTDLDAAVEQLVDLAIRSGGPDNITCVLADVIDSEGEQAPSEQIITVGAVATESGEISEPVRSDNPAARAHLLAQSSQQVDGDLQSARQDASGAKAPSDSGEHESAAGLPGRADEDDDDGLVLGGRRRRWPVVTSVLVLLVGVVGAAGYYGWRLTQSQYYVGTADGRVVVFRGLSEAIAGLSLSSIVQRTNIPLSELPYSEVISIKSTIGPEQNLQQTQRIIMQFRHDYRCAAVAADIFRWVAHRPKPSPHPVIAAAHHSTRTAGERAPTRAAHHTATTHQQVTHKATTSKGAGTKSTRQVSGKRAGTHIMHRPSIVKQPKYPPKPVLPRFCPAFFGAVG